VADDKQLRGEDFMNEVDRSIQALTPEDRLDTSDDEREAAENARFADQLHEEELADSEGEARGR
jgi:hypothetical protein